MSCKYIKISEKVCLKQCMEVQRNWDMLNLARTMDAKTISFFCAALHMNTGPSGVGKWNLQYSKVQEMIFCKLQKNRMHFNDLTLSKFYSKEN